MTFRVTFTITMPKSTKSNTKVPKHTEELVGILSSIPSHFLSTLFTDSLQCTQCSIAFADEKARKHHVAEVHQMKIIIGTTIISHQEDQNFHFPECSDMTSHPHNVHCHPHITSLTPKSKPIASPKFPTHQ